VFLRNLFIIFIITFSQFSFSQSAEKDTVLSRVKNARLKTVIATEATLYTGTLIALNSLWYKDYPRSSFHFFNDNKEWLQMDKAGHFFTAYYVGKIGIDLLKWSAVEERKSTIYGGLLGFTFLTTVEVFDGFSEQWGASWGDVIANTAGAGMVIAQHAAWEEQRILLKYSFHKSPFAKYRPNLLGSDLNEQIIKDYNGQTYWLSVNPASFKMKFPSWLNIALGYGASGMIGGFSNPFFDESNNALPFFIRHRQYYLSMDVDLTKIKTQKVWLKTVFNTFGFLKLPFPTIEYNRNENFKFHPLYF